jgi:hypothetical protein
VRDVKPRSARALPLEVAPLVLIAHCLNKPTWVTGKGGASSFPRLGGRTLVLRQSLISIEKKVPVGPKVSDILVPSFAIPAGLFFMACLLS